MFYLKCVVITAAMLLSWAGFTVFGTLGGWWYSPMVKNDDPQAFVEAAIDLIATENVGNVALLLIEDGQLFAEHYASMSQEVGPDTVFAVASMSKWITALGIMQLVQSGRIDLDAPIATYLSRWRLPPSEFNHDDVTVRRLLSHTSGLGDGLGFGDYEPDEVLPALEDTLAKPRSSSGRSVQIALVREPGSEWDYSGGGYLILQLIVEEVSGRTFEDYMQSALLRPLAMNRSTFVYIGLVANRSNSYDEKGQQATLYKYAASAATGFASSVSDMAKLVQAQLAPSELFRQETIAAMREPNATYFGMDMWGLGTILYAPTGSADYVYGHDGQNEPALNSAVRINPDSGDAIIVFSSGNKSLATRLGFEWVFWQTGVPDVLGLGYVIEGGIRVMMLGCALILLLAIVSAWWYRRVFFA